LHCSPSNGADVTRSEREELSHWFAEQVQPEEPALRAYLHGFVESNHVDDIIQETYVRVLRARERAPILHLRGLLFATARNVARDLFRRHVVANTISIAEMPSVPVFDDAAGVVDNASRHEEAELLHAAIAALPPRCREVLILRKFENLSHREIAERLGITEHTVEAQLTKALHRCEEYLSRHGLP
jgi:RNA polymerase sigma-70 factor (ECF subfamily)